MKSLLIASSTVKYASAVSAVQFGNFMTNRSKVTTCNDLAIARGCMLQILTINNNNDDDLQLIIEIPFTKK
jgi:hypothetical protein